MEVETERGEERAEKIKRSSEESEREGEDDERKTEEGRDAEKYEVQKKKLLTKIW